MPTNSLFPDDANEALRDPALAPAPGRSFASVIRDAEPPGLFPDEPGSASSIAETIRGDQYGSPAWRLRGAIRHGQKASPDQAARVLRMQAKTGLPVDLIERNLDEIERRAAEQDFDAETFRRTSPMLAAWLTENPQHPVLVRDDIDRLSYFERQFRHIGQQFERGKLTTELAGIGEAAFMGRATHEQRRRQADIEAQLGQETDFGIEGFVEGIPGAVANQIPIFGQSIFGKAKGAAIGAGTGAAGGAVIGAIAGAPVGGVGAAPGAVTGAVIGGKSGALVGWKYGAAVEAARMESALAYLDFEKLRDESGQPLDRETAVGAAAIVGVINGVLEGMTGVERLVDKLPGVRNLTRTGVKELLRSPTTRAAFLRYARTIGATMAVEGGTEFLQSMVKTAAGEIAAAVQDGLIARDPAALLDRIFSDEHLAQARAEGRAGAQAGGGMSVALAAPQLAQGVRQARQAKANADLFQALGENVAESKTYQRLPAQLQAVLERMTQDGPVENVYLPLDAWQTYWQSQNVDAREAATEVLGSPVAYDQAVAAGHDLVIPTARYAVTLAPTEHNAHFVQELRLAPEQMNAREAAEFERAAQTEAEDQVQAEAALVPESAGRVRQDIVGQLLGTGFDRSTIESYAQIYESVFRSLGERAGIDPFQLYQRFGLKVSRPTPDVLKRASRVDAIDALIDRLRSGEIPSDRDIFGKSLVEFLREKGGLQDEGGELKSRDPDKGLRPFQRRLIQPKGMTLDTAREMVAQLGYVSPDSTVAEFLDAIDADLRGNPVYPPGALNDQRLDLYKSLEALDQHLAQLGVDVKSTSNEEIKRLLQAGIVEQSTDAERLEQPKRGAIRFGSDRQFNIDLLERADLSTFLHESGHFYLEAFGDVVDKLKSADSASLTEQQQRMIADYADVLKWLGVSSRQEIGTEQHEQWARGIEAYLREGKAPSPELRSVFSRFRAWLINIYRSLKQLDVELSDDVRGVMDRLFATDREIEAAEREAEILPLFTDAASAGMTEAEFKAYRATVQSASDRARDELQAKLMGQLQREHEQWWKDQRRQVRAEVEAEIRERPEYVALSVLQRGTMPDGSALPEGMEAVKLDRVVLVQQYGAEFLKRLPRPYVYAAKGGIHPDAAADMFGFTSGEALVTALANARPIKALIEAETDARMREVHGDMLLDGSIADAARAAVHGEERGAVIRAELAALHRKQREVQPFIQAERNQQAQVRREGLETLRGSVPPHQALTQMARGIIAQQKTREVLPHTYLVAARRAAKGALEALGRGDYLSAATFKQRELLNHELYREALRARGDVDAIVDYLAGFGRPGVRERIGKAGADYLEQIDAIMERFDFRKSVSLKAIERRRSLAEWLREKEHTGETLGEELDIPDKVLNEAFRTSYKELTIEELRGLRDVVRQIEQFARLKNKLLAAQGEREREDARNELIAAVVANTKNRGEPPFTRAGLTRIQAAGQRVAEIDASLLKMEQLVEWLDGGDIAGPWHRYLWNGAADAQAREYDYTKRITAKVAQAVINIPESIRSRMLERVEIEGIRRTMTRKDLIGVALNVGNASNYDKLIRGMGWSEAMVQDMLNRLTTEEMQFVQSIWDTLESMWPDIAKLQRDLTGIEPERIEAQPVVTRAGEFRGGYYPVMYDPLGSEQGQLQLSSRVGGMLEDSYVRATTPKGHTKARVEGFTRPMDLDLDNLPSHIAGVVKDLTHRKWLIDANWVVHDPQIRQALRSHLGDPYVKLFPDWVRQVVNDRNHASLKSLGIWRQMIERFRYNVMVAAMGFKASTMLSQIAGAGASIEILGAKHFAAGVAQVLSRPRASYEFATEQSGEMRHRLQTRDRDLRDQLRALSGRTDLLARIQETALAGIAWADMMVSLPTWTGGYLKAIEDGLSREDAVLAGDRAVRLSQGAGGAKDLASVMARNDVMRIFTMFYTPFSALYGRLRDIGHSVGDVKDVPQAAIRLFWVWIVAATIGELASGKTPDKGDGDDWLKWWLRAVGLYPFLSVPILRDIANAAGGEYGYQLSPIAQAFSTLASTARTAAGVATGDKEIGELAAKVLKTSGFLLGLPVGQVMITGDYLIDLYRGDEQADDLGQFAHDLLYRRQK